VDEINSQPLFCPISDAPAKHDTFTSHQPVADALARMIRSEENRGKLVGLSGPWGSGKSTIVELLRNRLRSTEDAQLFVWDAWAYQGDPLRQSFLESVTEFLSSERLPWIESEKWKDRLDLLSGRKVKVETTTEKRFKALPD
jgi:translation initiation factor RLI1